MAKDQQSEFEQRKIELENARLQLAKLSTEVAAGTTPILLTEGKSDPIILKEAWNRLYPNQKMNFRILSCDTLPDGGAAGAGMLRKALESCRPDLPITIGLFDKDYEGSKELKGLDKNFIAQAKEPDIRLHKNMGVAAFLIPDVNEKQRYINAKNLSIEFLFPENCIIKTHNNIGLNFSQKIRSEKIENSESSEEETTEKWYRTIDNGNKVYFAENIVPTFPDKAFVHFKLIFERFRSILCHLKKTA